MFCELGFAGQIALIILQIAYLEVSKYMNENNLKKVKNIIENEDVRNPLSDDEISKRLSVLRETVTNLRHELKFPNSRQRKKIAIIKFIKLEKEKNSKLDSKQITIKLVKSGFDVSSSYINKILNEYSENLKLIEKKDMEQKKEIDIFSSLVGYDGSLRKCIKQAKASVLYPPFGLSTLIIGESGTGKTLFVEYMHKYAVSKGVIDKNAPFIALNCADYGDNPQLLLSILYGYKKGSFTGADEDEEGLVEKANNGMLFLDEIHRLPPKGQEILFSLLDKGTFKRLGETYNDRKANVFFIGATTEDIESVLLTSFRRRIPMLISIPSLKDRSIREKVRLIYTFFQMEADRTNSNIFVSDKIIKSFALKSYQGNIGQIKSEIQVTCANAYIDKINSGKDEIDIGLNEMLYNNFFSEDAIINNYDISELNMIINDKLFVPKSIVGVGGTDVADETKYSLPRDIYEKIENKYNQLKRMDLSQKEMEKIMWSFIIKNFNNIDFEGEKKGIIHFDSLKYIIKDNILNILKKFIQELKVKYNNRSINKNFIIYLAIHINEAVKRIRYKFEIINPNISYIKENMKEEYQLAAKLALEIEKCEKIGIPEDEIGFIAIYVKKIIETKIKRKKIGIIVICHGKIATEMVAVVNKLMNINSPIAIDMPLEVNPSKIFEKTIEISKILNNDKGILFLVDMGSLVNIGEEINKKTGIKTRTIDRIDLLTVLEAVRKVYVEEEKGLDDIYYELINSKYKFQMIYANHSRKPPAVIAMCLTGRGIAQNIKNTLERNYKYVKIFTLSLIDENLKDRIEQLKVDYNIVAIVGTINPGIEGIKFVPFEQDFERNEKVFLDYILKQNCRIGLSGIVDEKFIMLDYDMNTKHQILETMCEVLFNNGYVKKEYINSVLEREKVNTTYFKGDIAIPHGLSAYVNKSCIVFMRLKSPVKWDNDGRMANLICMLAISDSDINTVTELFKILKQRDKVKQLMKAKTSVEFMEIIEKCD